MMVRINTVVGHSSEPGLAATLHELEHCGKLERLALSSADTYRKRLRVSTDKGTDCAIALDRSVQLEHGSVLFLTPERAIVVELAETPWLVFEATNLEGALELGFLAGHHHWRVKFDGAVLRVALEQPEDDYMDRLKNHLSSGSVRFVGKA